MKTPKVQDAYAKILDVINSCTRGIHITYADKMVRFFGIMFPEENKRYRKLQWYSMGKFNELTSTGK